MVNSPKN